MNEINTPQEFHDICPFSDSEFHQKMAELVTEEGFKHAVTWVMPDIDYDAFCQSLLKIKTKQVIKAERTGIAAFFKSGNNNNIFFLRCNCDCSYRRTNAEFSLITLQNEQFRQIFHFYKYRRIFLKHLRVGAYIKISS